VQEVERDYGIPVVAVATLDDLMAFLRGRGRIFKETKQRWRAYRQEYGVARS
jgi:orotate phosphoribosyltransferase